MDPPKVLGIVEGRFQGEAQDVFICFESARSLLSHLTGWLSAFSAVRWSQQQGQQSSRLLTGQYWSAKGSILRRLIRWAATRFVRSPVSFHLA